MDISKHWFVKNAPATNVDVCVLYSKGRIHIYKSVFKYGYRRLGFSVRKGNAVVKQIYGSVNLVTFQIGFSYRLS